MEEFTTRAQFNEFKKKQKSFTNRSNRKFQFVKNEFGVVANKKEIDVVKQNTRKAQRIATKLSKQMQNKPFISGGKTQGTVGQRMMQMGRPNVGGITVPKDFNFDNIRTRRQFEEKMQNMKERSDERSFDRKMEQVKDSFIKLLELSFNSDAESLIRKLENINGEDFLELYMMVDEFNFDYYASERLDSEVYADQLEAMESAIDKYNRGLIDMDLKGF